MGYAIWPDGYTGDILSEVFKERNRQEELKRKGKFKYSCADAELDDGQCYMVLGEEFGEVGHALNEMIGKVYSGREIDLAMVPVRTELIQVAAVAVAWAERIDKVFAARSTNVQALNKLLEENYARSLERARMAHQSTQEICDLPNTQLCGDEQCERARGARR